MLKSRILSTHDKKRMIRLMAEELAAAISLRDKNPNKVDLFAAGVADGIRSSARWLEIGPEVEDAAKELNS